MTLLLAFACTSTEPPVDTQDTAPPYENFTPEGSELLSLTTRDGETIAADHWVASSADRPLVVLVHMDPTGSWNRTNWDGALIEGMIERDIGVLRFDRRGAGDSTGTPSEAFETVKGAYDTEACTLHAAEAGFGELVVWGASNGTTSTLDYAALADSEGWPAPDAFGMLSAVGATTNNHEIADMPPIPGNFSFPASEADNNEPWQAADPGNWTFVEYDPGAHGTRMFASAPKASGAMLEWLDATLQ